MPLNIKEEQEFKDLHDKCRALKVMPPPAIFIGLKVEKDGKILTEDKQRGHSWTRNFYNYLFATTLRAHGDGSGQFGAGYMSAKANTNAIASASTHAIGMNRLKTPTFNEGYQGFGCENTSDCGILIGSGSNTFSTENVDLASKVTALTSSVNTHIEALTYDDLTFTWTLSVQRVFNNNSGASVDINETGYAWRIIANADAHRFFNGGNNLYYLMERSVLSPIVTVPDGAQFTVTYDFSMDFSSIDDV